MEPLTLGFFFQALLVIALLMAVTSIPTLIISARNAYKLLRRYKALRMLKDMDDIPSHIMDEWNAVNNNINYVTIMTEELEKLNALRPAIFQAEVAIVLMVFMAFVPGYTSDLMAPMIVIIALSVVATLFGYRCIKKYTEEYVKLLVEIKEKGKDYTEGMYG